LIDKRTVLLQKEPSIADTRTVAQTTPIIKTVVFLDNSEQQRKFEKIMQKLGKGVDFIWSHNPYLDPIRPAIITASGVNKATATIEVCQKFNINPKSALGIGDSESDWNFMKLCGSVGVVGSQSTVLANYAMSKGEGNYCIAPDVAEHGLIEIFKYYELT
jgi:hydroxymethylpyrimidine pyrophosphatase-like HAD family hydrolase